MNFIFALVFGLGVYMAVLSPVAKARVAKKQGIDRISRMTDVAQEVDFSKFGFWSLVRMKGIRFALAQSELDVDPIGFFRTGAVLGVVTAGVVMIATTNLLVAILMGLVSQVIYVDWLHWRRDAKRLEYDSGIANMCDRLAAGAQLNNTMLGALSHANLSAPPSTAGDFLEVERAMTQGANLKEAFEAVIAKRRSYALEMLYEALYTWSSKGTSISLFEVLDPLSKTIREISKERLSVEAKLTGVRFRLLFVAASPIAYVLLIRNIMPAINQVYNTPLGTVFLTVGFGISVLTYYLGEAQMNNVRKALEIE